MIHCTNHCRTCHTHFHSTTAFDRHRQGPPGERVCGDVNDLRGLYELTDDGTCDLARGDRRENVRVWSTEKQL